MKYKIRETGNCDNNRFETDRAIFFLNIPISWMRMYGDVMTITIDCPFETITSKEGITIKPSIEGGGVK